MSRKIVSVHIDIASFLWETEEVLRGSPEDVVKWLSDLRACFALRDPSRSEYGAKLFDEVESYRASERERKREAIKKRKQQEESSKPKENDSKPIEPKKVEYSQEFEDFWKIVPRKDGKFEAFKAFRKAKEFISPIEMKNAILNQIENDHFKGSDSKDFIPHVSTWLNQRRWEDEVKEVQMSITEKWINGDD